MAHDFWVEPGAYRVSAGDDVEIELREGERFKGNTLPYITDWFTDFSLTTADGSEPVVSWIGNDPALLVHNPSHFFQSSLMGVARRLFHHFGCAFPPLFR